jgi:hypothetical protein
MRLPARAAPVVVVAARWATEDEDDMAVTMQASGIQQAVSRLQALRAAAALLARTDCRVGSPSPVALWQNAGTQPHLIRARNARALHWEGGGTRFARSVRHPGTRPLRFFERGAQQARPQIASFVRVGLAQVAAGAPPQAAAAGLMQGGRAARDAIRALAPRQSGAMAATIGVYVDGRLVA